MLARVLAVLILSVCLSHACFMTNQTMHCRYFDTTLQGNHSSFLTPTAVGERRPIEGFCLKFALKVTHPFIIAELARSLCHSWAACLLSVFRIWSTW